MGFGCNAAGVVGCRIIDSPRERLVAILTNSLVPCNGRFPAMISLLAIYFTGLQTGGAATLYSALLLTGVLVLGVVATLFLSWLLSSTLLKGTPSSFALELPPYRRPQVGQVIVRSIFDRTLFVLGRAVLVAAPAGLLIWMLGNIQVSGVPLLTLCAECRMRDGLPHSGRRALPERPERRRIHRPWRAEAGRRSRRRHAQPVFCGLTRFPKRLCNAIIETGT